MKTWKEQLWWPLLLIPDNKGCCVASCVAQFSDVFSPICLYFHRIPHKGSTMDEAFQLLEDHLTPYPGASGPSFLFLILCICSISFSILSLRNGGWGVGHHPSLSPSSFLSYYPFQPSLWHALVDLGCNQMSIYLVHVFCHSVMRCWLKAKKRHAQLGGNQGLPQ